jgi:hypothetical protein
MGTSKSFSAAATIAHAESVLLATLRVASKPSPLIFCTT